MSTQPALAGENYVIPAWTFADRLRKARQLTGMKQDEFAAHIQQKPSAYAQWEADNNKPRDIVAVAKRVEMLTRIPAQWLLGLDTEKAPTPEGEGLVHPLGLEPRTHWIRDGLAHGNFGREIRGDDLPATRTRPHPLDERRQMRPVVTLRVNGSIA